MKVFYLGVDVSKKKLDLCLRSNGKDILYIIGEFKCTVFPIQMYKKV